MGLFQKPASTQEEIERGRPLALPPEEVATFDEETWYARVFRGEDVPQLTVRAVAMGAGLGFLLAFTNVYLGLKTGWNANVALTACIASFAIWKGLAKAGVARTPLSILESNCMQSTASAAGYSTGTMTSAAIPAMLLLTVTAAQPGGRHLPWPVLVVWTFFTALLGVVLAIPMKRTMINQERLTFPSGTAAAVTLQVLYGKGAEALGKARVLMYAALAAGAMPLLMDLKVRHGASLIPPESAVFDRLPARGVDPHTGARLVPSDWTMVLDHRLLMVAVGGLVGVRICLGMLLGALALAYWLGPAALAAGVLTSPGRAWLEIGLWVGAPMLVTAGLTSLAFGWRSLARSLRSLGAPLRGARRRAEVPMAVFVVGLLVAGVGVVGMAQRYFEISWGFGIAAVALAFVLSLAACRTTGESDITPQGPMVAITQFVFGGLVPHNPVANLGSAAMVGTASLASADLLTDLKSGYLLGASPRRQLVAQLLGIVPGTLAAVLCYYLLVPDATALTGARGAPPAFPAPGAQMYLTMARLLTGGLEGLPPMARHGVAWGAAGGVLLTLAERLPRGLRRWVPSATGVGLGMVFPFQYALSLFLGSVLAWLWVRRRRAEAERYLMPLVSGLIAGESIVGVAVAALNNFVLR